MSNTPQGGEWTIIFNTVVKQWGTFKYDASKDALRVIVKSQKSDEMTERMTFDIKGNKVHLKWANLGVAFKVK